MYHEYESGRKHYTGPCGRNIRRNDPEPPPVTGDEPHYKRQAITALQALADIFGKFEYQRWFEAEFEQGGDANRFTWRQIRDAARGYLREIADDECSCGPNDALVCPACAALLNQREVEF
jgi:hypothetical protein